jgi:hypothetical protein
MIPSNGGPYDPEARDALPDLIVMRIAQTTLGWATPAYQAGLGLSICCAGFVSRNALQCNALRHGEQQWHELPSE